MIGPGLNGAIVDTGDLEALTTALDGLLDDPEALRAMGERARAHVVEKHSIEAEVAAIHGVYDSLLEP